jgi:hypothetical protein
MFVEKAPEYKAGWENKKDLIELVQKNTIKNIANVLSKHVIKTPKRILPRQLPFSYKIYVHK